MSAEKPEKKPASPGPDPAAVLTLAAHVRRFLQFQGLMGVTGYPASQLPRDLFQARDGRLVSPGQLSDITKDISQCRRCVLAGLRSGQRPGHGPARADLLIVGDYSRQVGEFAADTLFGREEDAMLTRMMEAIGFDREQVHVTNCLKCCPRAGLAVDAGWAQSCADFLQREILAVAPRLILAMGEMAVSLLLAVEQPLVRLRGRVHACRLPSCQSFRVLVSYHPHFLLQHPEMKQAAWRDLQQLQRLLAP